VDPVGREYELRPGEAQRLFGGLGCRYWLGEPGASELIAGSMLFWEPIRLEDWGAFLEELQLAFREEVSRRVRAQHGLEVRPEQLDPERLEWLTIREADEALIQRLSSFCQGWSRALPKGKQLKDLTGSEIGRLARMMGLQPSKEGDFRLPLLRSDGSPDPRGGVPLLRRRARGGP
jgi:hypothetical protein